MITAYLNLFHSFVAAGTSVEDKAILTVGFIAISTFLACIPFVAAFTILRFVYDRDSIIY